MMEENINEKEVKTYELAVLVRDEAALPRIKDAIVQHSGTMVSEPRARKIALAYTINGVNDAVFAPFIFRAIPDDAKQLENDFRSNNDLVRFMLLRTNEESAARNSARGMGYEGAGATGTGGAAGSSDNAFGSSNGEAGSVEDGKRTDGAKPSVKSRGESLSNEDLEELLKKI